MTPSHGAEARTAPQRLSDGSEDMSAHKLLAQKHSRRENVRDKAKRRLGQPSATGSPKFVIGAADECWPWLGYTGRDGYGRLLVGDKFVLAHRLVYRMLAGRIYRGHQLDHLCRNRACVNPGHLDVVSNQENQLRAPRVINARTRTHCEQGHEFTPENSYYRPSGSRQCRECRRNSFRKWKRSDKGQSYVRKTA